MRTHEHHTGVGGWSAVLDVGDEIGALVLYTSAELEGAEIEVSPVDQPGTRTHSQVHRRYVAEAPVYAALYVALPAGVYRIWDDDPKRSHQVTITGGGVAEVDWR